MPPSPPSRILSGVVAALEPLRERIATAGERLRAAGENDDAVLLAELDADLVRVHAALRDLAVPRRYRSNAPTSRGFLHVARVADEGGPIVEVVVTSGHEGEREWTLAVQRDEFDMLVAEKGPLREWELVELEVSALDVPRRIAGRPE